VVKNVIAGRPISFYRLVVLDDSRSVLLVPVEKAKSIGVRLLSRKADIPALLDRMKHRARTFDNSAKTAKDWKKYRSHALRLFTSGSAFDLAELVKLLTELGNRKTLTFSESRMLERARNLLISEISEAMGTTRRAAEEQVDEALDTRKKGPRNTDSIVGAAYVGRSAYVGP
jgi:CarD family transcriptional regulator